MSLFSNTNPKLAKITFPVVRRQHMFPPANPRVKQRFCQDKNAWLADEIMDPGVRADQGAVFSR